MATGKVPFSRNWFKFNYRENLKQDSSQTLILLRFTISMLSGQLLPEENCLLVTVAIWVKVRVGFRFGGKPDNCPRGKVPPVNVRVWFRVSFGLGTIFLGGNCSRIYLLYYISHAD